TSLAPALEDFKACTLEYTVDRKDTAWTSRDWRLPFDVWQSNPGHRFLSRTRFEQADGPEYFAAATIPVLPENSIESTFMRLLRLGLFAVGTAGPMAFAGWCAFDWRTRRMRLRNKEVPYVVGGAIVDPKRFYGRGELLQALRNEIASSSIAVV